MPVVKVVDSCSRAAPACWFSLYLSSPSTSFWDRTFCCEMYLPSSERMWRASTTSASAGGAAFCPRAGTSWIVHLFPSLARAVLCWWCLEVLLLSLTLGDIKLSCEPQCKETQQPWWGLFSLFPALPGDHSWIPQERERERLCMQKPNPTYFPFRELFPHYMWLCNSEGRSSLHAGMGRAAYAAAPHSAWCWEGCPLAQRSVQHLAEPGQIQGSASPFMFLNMHIGTYTTGGWDLLAFTGINYVWDIYHTSPHHCHTLWEYIMLLSFYY